MPIPMIITAIQAHRIVMDTDITIHTTQDRPIHQIGTHQAIMILVGNMKIHGLITVVGGLLTIIGIINLFCVYEAR